MMYKVGDGVIKMKITSHDGLKFRVKKDGTFDKRYKTSTQSNAKIFVTNKRVKEINNLLMKRDRSRKINKVVRKVVFVLFIITLLAGIVAWLTSQFAKQIPEPTVLITPIAYAKEIEIEEPKEPTTEEIICSYDWNCEQALAIVKCESGFNQYAINLNTNGTFDLGLWQINDVHRISREDRFNISKATAHAYKIYQGRGNNFSAWVCAEKLGIK